MLLNYIQHSDTPGVPLIIAHGLYGSARNWGVLGKRLGDTRPVYAVDMRNHGGSFWDADHSYTALATDLAQVIDHLGGRADVLGHSMGGKAAMVAATAYPDMVRRLIVADIAPVAYPHTQQPMIDAMQSVDLSAVQTRADADAQLQPWVADATVRAFLLQSLDVKARRWRLNLTALSDNMDQIVGFPERL